MNPELKSWEGSAQMTYPKQYWLDLSQPECDYVYKEYDSDLFKKDCIHVIEYKAVSELKDEIEILKERITELETQLAYYEN